MKKKLLALLMAVAMVATVVGCGSTPAETPSAGESKVEENKADDTTTSDDTTEKRKVDLLVWSPSEDQADDKGNWLQTMCEQFAAAHPELEITFTYGVCAEGDAKSTVTQDIEAAADVYMFANDNVNDLLANGAIARLGGSTLDYVNNNIPASLVNSVTVNGGVYGIPFTSNTWFMYYNKSIFTEEDVKNLETMLAKGKVAFPLNNSWYFASFYAGNGCTLFGNGTDEAAGIQFGGANAVEVTNYLVDLVKNPNFVHDVNGAGMAGLKDGSIGAIFSGNWDYQNVVDAIGAENVGACQLPTYTLNGEAKQLKAFAGSKAIGVNPNCPDQDVAIALAAWLGGQEAQQSHFDLRGTIPANTTVAASDAVKNNVVATAESSTIANTSIMQPIVGAMGNYWTPATNMADAIFAGEVTHENAAEKTAEMNDAMNGSVVE